MYTDKKKACAGEVVKFIQRPLVKTLILIISDEGWYETTQ